MRYPEIAADTAAATTERLDRARRLQLGWLDRVIRSLPLTHPPGLPVHPRRSRDRVFSPYRT